MSIELFETNISEIRKILEKIESECEAILSSAFDTNEQIVLNKIRYDKMRIEHLAIEEVLKGETKNVQKLYTSSKVNVATRHALYVLSHSVIPSLQNQIHTIKATLSKIERTIIENRKLNNETIREAVKDMSICYTTGVEKWGYPNLWNTSQVTDMSYLFSEKLSLYFNINNWDVSNVTNMEGMFKGCENLYLKLPNWDVSKVTNMKDMFESRNLELPDWYNPM